MGPGSGGAHVSDALARPTRATFPNRLYDVYGNTGTGWHLVSCIEAPNAVEAIAKAKNAPAMRGVFVRDWRADLVGSPPDESDASRARATVSPPPSFLVVLLLVATLSGCHVGDLLLPKVWACTRYETFTVTVNGIPADTWQVCVEHRWVPMRDTVHVPAEPPIPVPQ